MEQYISKSALVAEIEKLHGNPFYRMAIKDVLSIIDTMQEEPVSEDLEKASKNYALNNTPWDDCKDEIQESFKAGAKWQKEHLMKDAVEGEIGYWNLRWLSVNADLPRTVEEGDKVKVILING